MVSTKFQKLFSACSITQGNNATCANALGMTYSRRTVLYHKAFRNIYTQPTSGLQMHGTLVGVSAIIINNILFFEPTVKTKEFKVEINIAFDRRARQSIGNIMLLQILQKRLDTVNQMKIILLTVTEVTVNRFLMFRVLLVLLRGQPGSDPAKDHFIDRTTEQIHRQFIRRFRMQLPINF